jgi:seryl-tRNA(Sec) selenium transferase
MLECEAAYVTSGGAGGLALAAAACMTGNDTARIERLPDTAGMKDEIIVQKVLRTKYDRCVTIPGARLVEVGDPARTSVAQFEAGFTEDTCAVYYLAPGLPGALPVEDVIEIAHGRGVPVIVDAAGQTYPLDNLRKYTRLGADLVVYAAKYFNAPHSTGVLCGRRDLVEAASLNGFVSFESNALRTIGRSMKVDRQEVVAVIAALREWLTMNHEDRLLKYADRVDSILRELSNLPSGIEVRRISEIETPLPVVREGIRVYFNGASGKTADGVAAILREGTPSIWTMAIDGALNVSVAFFNDGEEQVVAERLKAALSS